MVPSLTLLATSLGPAEDEVRGAVAKQEPSRNSLSTGLVRRRGKLGPREGVDSRLTGLAGPPPAGCLTKCSSIPLQSGVQDSEQGPPRWLL